MSETDARLEALQRRISAAMDRIGTGVEALAQRPAALPDDDADGASLRDALDEERQANAQLQERLAALKARHEDELTELRAVLEDQRAAFSDLDQQVQRARAANDILRDSNRALREANAAGLADAGLIDAGLSAELEALRAARELERAEGRAILSAIAPLVAEGTPEGGRTGEGG